MSTLDSDLARPARRKPESLIKLRKAARKLFVERGYHATRPQDIAREAGLGHGTFYLHYPDKRACFLAFVEEARRELDGYMRARSAPSASLEQMIANVLNAIYDYSETHPGVLKAALTDEAVIDAEETQAMPLLERWARDWSEFVRHAAADGRIVADYDPQIAGQAILGAIHLASSIGWGHGTPRNTVIDNLTRFLVRALRP